MIRNGMTARGPKVSDGFVFLRNGNEVFHDFEKMILFTQNHFGSFAEVEQMIEHEQALTMENYAHNNSSWRHCTYLVLDAWERFWQAFHFRLRRARALGSKTE